MRKLKTTKAEQEANKKRRRWHWFHRVNGVDTKMIAARGFDGEEHVRRRIRPTQKPSWCSHEGMWRAVPRGGYAR